MKMKASIQCVMATTAAVLLAACNHNAQPAKVRGDEFRPNEEARAIQNIEAVQAARGARQDAMLYSAHFDGGQLNGLGRQKLDLMLQDEATAPPVVVYLDVPQETLEPARRSVTGCLRGRGLSETQVALRDGPNPSSHAPATDALAALQAIQPQASQQQQQSQGSAPTGYAPTPNPMSSATNH